MGFNIKANTMEYLTIYVQVARAAIYTAILSLVLTAILVPDAFGRWLQIIDEGRYTHLDCDCTEALDDQLYYESEGE
jgi:hypothetical protein